MSRLALVPFTLVSVVELVSDSESCIALIGACVMSGASLLVSIRSCLSYATDKVLKNEHSRRYDPAFPGKTMRWRGRRRSNAGFWGFGAVGPQDRKREKRALHDPILT